MKLLLLILYYAWNISINSNIEYRRLAWSDFKVKTVSDYTAAETVTEIGYNFDGSNVTVFCKFNKGESFVIKKAMTPYILNHEQRHFDITYIFAMKLVMELKKEQSLTEKGIEAVYDRVYLEKEVMQELYDGETKHSENKQKQSDWDNKIDKMLTNL